MNRGTIDFDDERTPKPVKKAASIDMNTGRSASIDVEPEENVQNEPKKTSFRSKVMDMSGKGDEEDRKGTWKGTNYNASDAEAHRDVRYRAPSWIKQTWIMFMVQMKQFSKAKWTYFALFTALLIPILMLASKDFITMMLTNFGFSTAFSNTYIAGLLSFLPLFLGLYTSVMCGSQIPQEFKDRTAYLNISLPMSRSSFYIGKYLAGFVLCLGIFMLAYGAAVATAMMDYESIFSDLLAESMMLTIIGVFAYSATAFCLGSFMKRGSSIVPLILMTVLLPMVITLVAAQYNVWSLTMLPFFLGEAALGILGASMSGSVGMIMMSYIDLTNVGMMAIIGIVWGVAFLVLGLLKTMRREM